MIDLAFFGDMAWKSALISAAALCLAAMLRSHSAAEKALVLRIGVIMLIALPLLALFLPAITVEAFRPEPLPADMQTGMAALPVVPETAAFVSAPADPAIRDDPTSLVLIAYLGGIFMIGARLVAGLWILSRWTKAARPAECPVWLAEFEKLRRETPGGARLRLLVSDFVPAPLSWGWLNPVILVDRDSLDQPEGAAAIIAHEAAHVARSDWAVLMLSRVAAILFWFNPLVWLLNREVEQQAEEAADAQAVSHVAPADYAQTLLTWARSNAGILPAHGIAPSARALSRRVRAVLASSRGRRSAPYLTAAAALACVIFAAPLSAVRLVEATPEAVSGQTVTEQVIGMAEERIQDSVSTGSSNQVAPSGIITRVAEAGGQGSRRIDAALPEADAIRALVMAQVAESRNSREFDQTVMEVQRQSSRAAAAVSQVRAAHIDREELDRISRRTAELGERNFRRGMELGAIRMEESASRMEVDGRRMLQQAAELRHENSRAGQAARAATEGERLTREVLAQTAEGLEEGGRGMMEGARQMRIDAREMRQERFNQ